MIPPIANKFVAGESIEEAINHAVEVNDRGLRTILNLLGEHYDQPERASEDKDEYLRLIELVSESVPHPCVSVKPTQLGLGIDDEVFRGNLLDILEIAAENEVFTWLDMEDHTTTEATIEAFEDFAPRFPDCVGVCLQANLRRTEDDLDRIANLPGKIRLVKGAYNEPKEISYREQSKVNRKYKQYIEFALEHLTGGVAVATHDPEIIEHAIECQRRYDTDFEFQMLMGVRVNEQVRLANQGFTVWQYAPFGNEWARYFYRRIRERKGNLWFALRAIFSN